MAGMEILWHIAPRDKRRRAAPLLIPKDFQLGSAGSPDDALRGADKNTYPERAPAAGPGLI